MFSTHWFCNVCFKLVCGKVMLDLKIYGLNCAYSIIEIHFSYDMRRPKYMYGFSDKFCISNLYCFIQYFVSILYTAPLIYTTHLIFFGFSMGCFVLMICIVPLICVFLKICLYMFIIIALTKYFVLRVHEACWMCIQSVEGYMFLKYAISLC